VRKSEGEGLTGRWKEEEKEEERGLNRSGKEIERGRKS
jgi:hypothetical protein